MASGEPNRWISLNNVGSLSPFTDRKANQASSDIMAGLQGQSFPPFGAPWPSSHHHNIVLLEV